MSEARTITDHDEIRRWAEERSGVPTIVADTESDDGSGILRFDFGEREESLKEIDWEDFFDIFEQRRLALLAQDRVDGKTSRFFKFVER
ncbi:hypothetical protein STAQ_10250 [Allostella sp. ATCC 35155]|nr:hypothetical protein STAQ_10250 [Stella sp. ATCC 35155]